MDDILKHREDIKNNILKSFQVDLQKSEENDIEKARSGVYGDTAENRKLNRVGQKYGSKKQDDEVSSQSSSKQNEDNHSKNAKSVETHYDNGQLKSRKNYKNDKLNGLWEDWYANGQLKSRRLFKDGEINGLWENWDENGQLKSRTNYENDQPNGLRETWDDNGKLKESATYKDGVKQ